MKKMALLLVVMAFLGNSAIAEEGSKTDAMKKHPPVTKEQRTQLADAHEKMATCLRSERPMGDCHQEMTKTCKGVMGKDNCPMMGGTGMMGKGKRHDMMDAK